MSLMFTQIYVKNKNSEEIYDYLTKKGALFQKQEYYEKPKEQKKLIAEKIKDENNYYIYNQFGYVVIQTMARNHNLGIEIDVSDISVQLDTQVVFIDHYEGYVTTLQIHESGKIILDAYMDMEDIESSKFVSEDDRFHEEVENFNKTMKELESGNIEYDEIYDELGNYGLLITSDPYKIFEKLGVNFNDLYNIHIDQAEDILVFSKKDTNQ